MLSNSHPQPSLWMNHLYSLITEPLSSSPPTTISLTHAGPIIKLGQFPPAISSLMHSCFKQDWWWSIKVLEWSCIMAPWMFWNPKKTGNSGESVVAWSQQQYMSLWHIGLSSICWISPDRGGIPSVWLIKIQRKSSLKPCRLLPDCHAHIWSDTLQT